jgi:hypothetical protein
MIAMLLLLSMGLLVKTTKYKDFLSDFKIWNQKNHAKDWPSSRELRQTFIDRRTALPMANSILF